MCQYKDKEDETLKFNTMEINNKEKYQVSGALLNKLLFDSRKSTLRQIELADIKLLKKPKTK